MQHHFNGHSTYSNSSSPSSTFQGIVPEDPYQSNLSPRPSYPAGCTQSSAELVKEITTLEDEITYLERHLLALYREAFEQPLPSLPGLCETCSLDKSETESRLVAQLSHLSVEPKICKDSLVYHKCTSPSQVLAGPDDCSHATALKSSSKWERALTVHGHHSLADHLVASRIDNNITRPDRLSEDIVRCISSIYCKLADPTARHRNLSASAHSSLSSSSTFSPRNLSVNWSPRFSEDTKVNQIQGLKMENGPYAAMSEITRLSLDDDTFDYAARMLQNFRLLVKNLEKVEPRKLAREEKLAFWINIHNALVMHAHLAYGTSNHLKTTSVLKAAYKIGGHCINADTIQRSILGIRSHYSSRWLEALVSPGKKFKTVGARHVYAIEYPEPLVHFALCSGASSDPAVRFYRAKNVLQNLKVAQEEFIQARVYLHKETKICLPKILYYFGKEMSLTMTALVEIVIACLSEAQQKAITRCMKGKPDKYILWLGQSSRFRYVVDREVSEGRLSV